METAVDASGCGLVPSEEPPVFQTLLIPNFDLASVQDNSVCLLIGRRSTGKTPLIKDLLWYKQSFPIGVVVEGSNSYSDIVPSLFVYEEYHSSIIKRVLERQTAVTTKICEGESFDRRAFVCMDDCLYDNRWVPDRYMRSLFIKGRHYGLLTIMAIHYAMRLPSALCEQFDVVFIMHETQHSVRMHLYTQFASTIIPTFELFCILMDTLNDKKTCLVINTHGPSEKPWNQCVFWYTPETHPAFKIGSHALWERSAAYERLKNAEENAQE